MNAIARQPWVSIDWVVPEYQQFTIESQRNAVDELLEVASVSVSPPNTNELSRPIGQGLVQMIEPRLVEDDVQTVEN